MESEISFDKISQMFALQKQALLALNLPVPSFLQYELKRILMLLPIPVTQFLLLFCLLKILLTLYFYRNKKWPLKNLFLLLFNVLLCCVVWHLQNKIYDKKIAFVVKDNAFVYAGPEQSFHKISQLKLGTQVQLIKCQSDMCQIMVHDSRGWVVSNQIETI